MKAYKLLPVLQALGTQHEYLEILRGHPQVSACQLQKCEAILWDIESALEEVVIAPIPLSPTVLKACISSVLKNIALMESNIAADADRELELWEKLRLQIAEAGLLALRFHLRVMVEALPTAADDTEWIH